MRGQRPAEEHEEESPEEEEGGAGVEGGEGGVRKGLSGLPNLGNTCYVNAALQALMHTTPFCSFFLECDSFLPPKEAPPGKNQANRRLVHTLRDIMQQVWLDGPRTASPHNLIRDILDLNPDYRGYGQQDSQEFLRRTLDFLHEELQQEHGRSSAHQRIGSDEDGQEGGAEGNSMSSPTHGDGHDSARHQRTKSVKMDDKSSIVWDVFRGKVLSEVKCTSCGKASSIEELILDLSVSIPGKKKRQKLAQQNGGKGSGKGEKEASSVSCSNVGWMSYIFGLFGSSHDRNVTLKECLLQYYEQEELSGGDKYKCDHCKTFQDSIKKVSLIHPPEVMTLHIKRFRYDSYFGNSTGSKVSDHVEFPLHDLDMRQFTKFDNKYKHLQVCTTYDLFALVEHRGSLSGGHYIGYIKHEDGGWYECDDTHVSPVTESQIAKLEGYMLFYRLRCPDSKKKERQQTLEAIRAGAAEPQVWISKLWFHRFLNVINPGPADMTGFTCHHEHVHIPQTDEPKLRQIPRSVWDRLSGAYGGGPRIDALIECPECQAERAELDRRRRYEQQVVHENDRTYIEPGQCWYIIDKQWLQSWLVFVNEDLHRPPPGPISNDKLLKPDGTPLEGLERGQHYRGVNGEVWSIFHQIYGGGPEIVRHRLDIYSPNVATSASPIAHETAIRPV